MQVSVGDLSDVIGRINELIEEINNLRNGELTRSLCVCAGIEKKLETAGGTLLEAVANLRKREVFVEDSR